MLLKEFEKRENSFANKVNTKLSEKEEMQEKVLRKTSQRWAVCFFLQTLIVVWQTQQNIFYIPTHFLSTAPALINGLSILLDLAKLKNLCSCRRTQPTLLRVQNTWEICIVIFKLPRVSRAVCLEVYKLIGPT